MELMATERLVPVADLEARGAGRGRRPDAGHATADMAELMCSCV